ncbi:hypothetical protein BJ508DRAFT_336016 [Ascobolus immersus RN42]|uniref:Uncharacterized protein n=1 Tax=Ascobolus immersus RN42 TaxID=1160509 RepID=A0A3N4HA28_ASCIM|nr:hypothetical protein BJ508DRAFT_336016 [Ascobolus immersus RN42]
MATHLYFVVAKTRGYEKDLKEHHYKENDKILGVYETLDKANKIAIDYAQQKYGSKFVDGWDFTKECVDNIYEPGIFYDEKGCFKMNVPPGFYKGDKCKWALMVSVHGHKVKGAIEYPDEEEDAPKEKIIGKTASGEPVPESQEPSTEDLIAAHFGLLPLKRSLEGKPLTTYDSPAKPSTTSTVPFVKEITLYELSISQEWFGSGDLAHDVVDTSSRTKYFLKEKAARDAFKEEFFDIVDADDADYYRTKTEGDEFFYGKDLPDWEDGADIDVDDDRPAVTMKIEKRKLEVVFRKKPKKGKGNVEVLKSSKIEVEDWDGTEEEYNSSFAAVKEANMLAAPAKKKSRTFKSAGKTN